MQAVTIKTETNGPVQSITAHEITRQDPTRTSALRRAFARDAAKRFRELRGVIRRAIVEEDVFGLRAPRPGDVTITTLQMSTPGRRAFAFGTSQAKIDGFMDWVRDQEAAGILETTRRTQLGVSVQGAWSDTYIQSGYRRGIMRARQELKGQGFPVPGLEESGGIDAVFNQPFHIDRVGLLYSRTFNDLQGITTAMDSQIGRVLAQGMAEGRNPIDIARLLTKTISGPVGGLGLTDTLGRFVPAERRAKMLARTEVIRAHHEATIQEYRNWAVEDVIVRVEWATAGANVCPDCADLEGQIFTLDQIQGMIPLHPQCRCVAIPVKAKPGDVPRADPATDVRPSDEAVLARPPGAYPTPNPAGVDTLQQYQIEGQWTAERVELHDSIIKKHLEGHVAQDAPVFNVMGGGPASGKSTALRHLGLDDAKKYVQIDVDEIKKLLPEFNPLVKAGNMNAGTFVHEESSYLSKIITDKALDARFNVVFDGSGDGSLEKIIAKLEHYASRGHKVVGHYVTVDVEAAVARNIDRAKRIGRLVPEDLLRELHEGVSRIFEEVIERGLFEEATLWDTNGPKLLQVMSSRGKDITIMNNEAWLRFTKKGWENLANPSFIMGAPLETEVVNEWLKANGAREWKAAKRPKAFKKAPFKECFRNATHVVMDHPEKYAYVEGYAYPADMGGQGFLHGWAVDIKTGMVVDTTWLNTETTRYYGIMYNREKYFAHIVRTDRFGVLGAGTRASAKILAEGLPEGMVARTAHARVAPAFEGVIPPTQKLARTPYTSIVEARKDFKVSYNIRRLEGVRKGDSIGLARLDEIADTLERDIFGKYPALQEKIFAEQRRTQLKSLALDQTRLTPLGRAGTGADAVYYGPLKEIRIGGRAMRQIRDQLSMKGPQSHVVGTGMRMTFRHEYGHHVQNQFLSSAQRLAWEDFYEANKRLFQRRVSRYSITNADEAFAEAFSAITSPKYGTSTATTLPRKIEKLLDELLGAPGASATERTVFRVRLLRESRVFASVAEAEETLRTMRVGVVGDTGKALSKADKLKRMTRVADEFDNIEAAVPGLRAHFEHRFVGVELSGGFVESMEGNKLLGFYRTSSSEIHMSKLAIRKKPLLAMGGNTFNVASDFSGVFRHEYGHHVWFKGLTGNQRLKFINYTKANRKIFGHKVSHYAGTNTKEAFAETFSAYTSPIYDRTAAFGTRHRLPQVIEELMDDLMGGFKRVGTIEEVAVVAEETEAFVASLPSRVEHGAARKEVLKRIKEAKKIEKAMRDPFATPFRFYNADQVNQNVVKYALADRKPTGAIKRELDKLVKRSKKSTYDTISYRGTVVDKGFSKGIQTQLTRDSNAIVSMKMRNPSSWTNSSSTAWDFAKEGGFRFEKGAKGMESVLMEVRVPRGTRVAQLDIAFGVGREHVLGSNYLIDIVEVKRFRGGWKIIGEVRVP